MSGLSLNSDFSYWVAPGELLNFDPEDPNEPFDDSFAERAEVCECGRWVDMNQEVVGDYAAWQDQNLDYAMQEMSVTEYYLIMSLLDMPSGGLSTQSDQPEAEKGFESSSFSGRPILTLPLKDYTKGMQVAIDDECVAAGSASRLRMSVRARYKR